MNTQFPNKFMPVTCFCIYTPYMFMDNQEEQNQAQSATKMMNELPNASYAPSSQDQAFQFIPVSGVNQYVFASDGNSDFRIVPTQTSNIGSKQLFEVSNAPQKVNYHFFTLL